MESVHWLALNNFEKKLELSAAGTDSGNKII